MWNPPCRVDEHLLPCEVLLGVLPCKWDAARCYQGRFGDSDAGHASSVEVEWPGLQVFTAERIVVAGWCPKRRRRLCSRAGSSRWLYGVWLDEKARRCVSFDSGKMRAGKRMCAFKSSCEMKEVELVESMRAIRISVA